jgi:hypothetical protein
MPRQLYPYGKKPWYPLDRRLGGPQSSSGRGGEEKNSQPLNGNNTKHYISLTIQCIVKIDTFSNAGPHRVSCVLS